MKLCSCGRPATHFVSMLTPAGEPTGKKKLMCDSFPSCRPISSNNRGTE